MHILLLTHYYPPGTEVGGVRPARLVRALRERGHRVTVVTAALPGEAPGLRLVEAGVVVRTVPSPTPIRLLLAALKSWRSPDGGEGQARTLTDAGGARAGETWRGRLRRWALSLLWMPDDRHRFVLPAVRQAAAVHAGDPVDLVYSTAPPFSVHLAAALLAAELRRPLVAEFRDPWTDVPRDHGRRSAVSDWLEARLERLVLRRAAAVVAVTPTVGGWLEAKRRAVGRPDDVVVTLNGIPVFEGAVDDANDPAAPIEVLHAGTLYLRRNPRPFLAALAAGIRRGDYGTRPVRVTFLGAHGERFDGVSVTDMAQELGLGEAVRFEGHLSPEACRQRMAAATALLLLAQDQPAQVPNKLFDYLAVRRPVLAVCDPDGESARILRQVGGHHILPEADGDAMRDPVCHAVLEAARTPASRWEGNTALAALQDTAQFDRLVDALEETTLRGRRT